MTDIARRAILPSAVGILCVAGVVVAATRPGDGADPGTGAAAVDRWLPLTSSPLTRTEVAAARIGKRIYVVGGFEESTGQTTNAAARYSIKGDRWKLVEPMPNGVNHPTATAHRGKLYVHGGFTAAGGLSEPTAALSVYKPERDRWRRLPGARMPRAAHALGAIDGKLYAAGGANDTSGQLTSLEIYDISERDWTSGPDLNTGRNHVGGVVAGGRLYVLGGRGAGGADFNLAERYDPGSATWETVAPLGTARSGFVAVNVRGRIVAYGGEELAPGGTTIEQVELYDPGADTWTPLPGMRTPRHGLGGAAKKRRVFALEGGPRPGFAFSSALEFLDIPKGLAP